MDAGDRGLNNMDVTRKANYDFVSADKRKEKSLCGFVVDVAEAWGPRGGGGRERMLK